MALDVLLLVGLCGLAGFLYRRPGRPPRQPEQALPLGPGDVVAIEEASFVVHDALALQAGGWRALYGLDAPAAPTATATATATARGQLLLVGDGEAEALWLLAPLAGRSLPLPDGRAPATTEHAGVRYALVGRFRTVAGAGATGAGPGRRLLLACYRGPGALRLCALRWDDADAALYAGRALPPAALDALSRPGRT